MLCLERGICDGVHRGAVPWGTYAASMATTSAGLLVHRRSADGGVDVLLVHPGGPFWAKKDLGAWSVPKGEYGPEEDPLGAARREFREELGIEPPAAEPVALGEVRQAGGKRVVAWSVEGDLDVSEVVSNTFELEWPPRSGRRIDVPEVDQVVWFGLEEARRRINPAQVAFLDRLADGQPVTDR